MPDTYTSVEPKGFADFSAAGSSWATIHDSAGNGFGGGLVLALGSNSSANLYNILYRVGVSFTIVIPVGYTVLSAKIRLKVSAAANTLGNPTVDIVDFTRSSEFNMLAADYTNFGTVLLSDTVVTLPLTVNNWYEWDLNAAGLAKLVTGKVSFGLRLSWDRLNTAPAWVASAWAESDFNNGQELVITTSTLAVQTLPATNISSGNAQLNGNLTDDGAEASVTVSFVAGTTTACSDWAGGAQAGTEGADFDAIITGLVPGQTIYFKAKAVGGDSGLIVYGAVLSFTLGNYPSKPLTRVMGIRDVFKAGMNGQGGQYYHDLLLGGLQTDWIPSFDKWEASVEGGENPQTKEKPTKAPLEVFNDPNYLAHGMQDFQRLFGNRTNSTIQGWIDKMKKDAEGK